jgi:hypothetical protein
LIVREVAPPGDQRYEEYPAPASSVTLPPWQNVVGPLGEIVGVGFGFTVTVAVGSFVEAQPLAS